MKAMEDIKRPLVAGLCYYFRILGKVYKEKSIQNKINKNVIRNFNLYWDVFYRYVFINFILEEKTKSFCGRRNKPTI